MEKLFELLSKQKELRALGKAIGDKAITEKRGFTPEEEKRMADLESEIQTCDSQILELRSASLNTLNIPNQPVKKEDEKRTLRSVIMEMAEKRSTISTSGGVQKMVQEILDVVAESNPLRKICPVYNIAGDGIVPVPGLFTSAFGIEGAVIAAADPAMTLVNFSAFNLQGRAQISDATFDDDFFNVMKLIAQGIGASLGEAEATAMLGNGAGASSPQGLFNSGTAVQTATTATITLADLITFLGSLETKWRSGREKLILSPSVLAGIINLRDATGKIELVSRDQTLNGIPYILTSLAPAYATTTLTKLMAFGDFSRAYAIAQRASDQGKIKTKIVAATDAMLENVIFAERIDGRVVDATAYKVWQVK